MASLVAWISVIAAATAASATQVVQGGSLRHIGHSDSSFVRALEFKHRLRVCNAYPSDTAVDVLRGKTKLTEESGPLAYKDCKDFEAPLKSGDKLEFKFGDVGAGTFAVSDLPDNDALLLLVVHRHDTLHTAVSFESHVFANLLNAQVAIIDTYKGAKKAAPKIMDTDGGAGHKSRVEELRYDSVVAVNPGHYDVVLVGEDGETKAKRNLVALNRESYIVLRTGVEAGEGQAYPEDLVVFPQSDPNSLQSGAIKGSSVAFATTFLAMLVGLLIY